jgi:hypothetical protein
MPWHRCSNASTRPMFMPTRAWLAPHSRRKACRRPLDAPSLPALPLSSAGTCHRRSIPSLGLLHVTSIGQAGACGTAQTVRAKSA